MLPTEPERQHKTCFLEICTGVPAPHHTDIVTRACMRDAPRQPVSYAQQNTVHKLVPSLQYAFLGNVDDFDQFSSFTPILWQLQYEHQRK